MPSGADIVQGILDKAKAKGCEAWLSRRDQCCTGLVRERRNLIEEPWP